MHSVSLLVFVEECRTTPSSSDPNKPCVFPFYYGGVTYTTCTSVANNGVLWCCTKGFKNGGKWGVCGESCPKEGKSNLRNTHIDVDMSQYYAYCRIKYRCLICNISYVKDHLVVMTK